jgi:hypothetical protein
MLALRGMRSAMGRLHCVRPSAAWCLFPRSSITAGSRPPGRADCWRRFAHLPSEPATYGDSECAYSVIVRSFVCDARRLTVANGAVDSCGRADLLYLASTACGRLVNKGSGTATFVARRRPTALSYGPIMQRIWATFRSFDRVDRRDHEGEFPLGVHSWTIQEGDGTKIVSPHRFNV